MGSRWQQRAWRRHPLAAELEAMGVEFAINERHLPVPGPGRDQGRKSLPTEGISSW
ncbi:MAG: hypothetical protein HY319_24150 [Armatimonadetes bacterium]|nr:hypothetical protein [Armatimonadota bacterium]